MMVSTLFLEKTLKTLEEGLEEQARNSDNLFIRDGVIQRFEYSFELAVKTLERMLKAANASIKEQDFFYKPMIRLAAKNGLIDSPQIWFDFRDARNKTSHAYDEDIAKEVFVQIPLFLKAAQDLLIKLKEVEQ